MRIINSWFVVRPLRGGFASLRSGSWFVVLLCFALCAVAYAAELNVPADVTTQTIILEPQAAEPSVQEGRVYYDDTKNQPYYYNGSGWQAFGGAGKTVATRIVAASNSLDTNRADYVCPVGGTTDQTEIQKAINDLGATGGAVYLLEGTYNISGAINWTANNTALIGAGRGTVLKAVTGTNVINAVNAANILITQLLIDGDDQGSDNKGIYFNQVTSSQIDKVWIEKVKGIGPNGAGIFFNNSDDNIISNSYLQSNGYAGILLDAGSNNNNLLGNNTQSNGCDGIYLRDSFNNTVSGNIARSSVNCDGIYLRDSSYNTISGNYSQLNEHRGILLDWDSDNNTVSGNIADTNVWDGIGLKSGGSGSPENNTVSGNNAILNKYNGILVEKSSNNAIVGNTVYDNGGSGDYNGIRLTSGSDNNLVSSNLLYKNPSSTGTGRPINLVSNDEDENYLVSNFITSWPASYNEINDAGTNTRYTDKIKLTLEPAAACPGAGCSGLADNQTLTPTGPTSYLRLSPTANIILGNPAIADGKSVGDILILEDTSTNTVTLNDDANVQLGAGSRLLTQNDTLTLTWNGTDWIETGFANN